MILAEILGFFKFVGDFFVGVFGFLPVPPFIVRVGLIVVDLVLILLCGEDWDKIPLAILIFMLFCLAIGLFF